MNGRPKNGLVVWLSVVKFVEPINVGMFLSSQKVVRSVITDGPCFAKSLVR